MEERKVLFMVLIFAFGLYQMFLLSLYFSNTRTIQVQRRTFDTIEYKSLKGHEIQGTTAIEEYKIIIKPKTFFDYLLLTNDKENLLTTILKFAAAICFMWYIYKLEYNNLFSKGQVQRGRLVMLLIYLAFVSGWFGLLHTSDFWAAFYVNKDAYAEKFDYYVDTKNYTVWYPIIFITVFGFYNEFGKYYNKMRESVSEIKPEN